MVLLLALPMFASESQPVWAHDQGDTNEDVAADIVDFYAWREPGLGGVGTDTVVAVLTFPIIDGGFDPDVLYWIHIAADEDTYDIDVRFGRNQAGDWGVRFANLPEIDGPIVGPIDTTLDLGNGATVRAGLFDNPAFFDRDGFEDTLLNIGIDEADAGELGQPLEIDNAFSGATGGPVDGFEGTNVHAIVVEFSVTSFAWDAEFLHLWASTARIEAP